MRGILKSVGVVALSIYLTQQLLPAIKTANVNTFLILVGLIYLVNILVEPLTKILFFIPSHLAALNLAIAVANILVLFFLSQSLNEIEVTAYEFPGFGGFGVSIAEFNLTAIQATLAGGILITLISGIVKWLAD